MATAAVIEEERVTEDSEIRITEAGEIRVIDVLILPRSCMAGNARVSVSNLSGVDVANDSKVIIA